MAIEIVLDVSLSCAWHDTLALARSHRLTNYAAAYLELALNSAAPRRSLHGARPKLE